MRLGAKRLKAIARDAGLAPASAVVLSLDAPVSATVLDPDRPFYPASMIKVPLVAATLAALAGGLPTALVTRVAVTEANMTANDTASPLQPGYRATLRELMQLSIAHSDNVATNVLFDVVGRGRATELARDLLALPATEFHRKLSGSDALIADPQWDGEHRNSHPAGDAARLFAAIADGAVAHAALLREMLAAQHWNDKLSEGLRPGDRFLHKTGDTQEVTHDGGILVTQEGRRYVVVAYVGLPSTPEHNARFAPFMRAVRELL
ncbi:MAG: serine hydrolase [Candidatus Tumulicola sp.]